MSLSELMNKLQASVTSAAPLLPNEETLLPPSDGISLLDTKTDIFLSYLQNLVFLVLVKLERYKGDVDLSDDKRQDLDDTTVKQLAELRLYLEKGVRPLEARLKYEIEKVVRAADGAGAPKIGKPKRSKQRTRRTSDASASSVVNSEASKSGSEETGSESEDDEDAEDNAYRPNITAFTKGPQAADRRSAKPGEKKSGFYRPPRITPTALPTTDELNNRARTERRARPIRSQAVDDYISSELADNPMAQPSIGSTITAGGRRTITDKERRREDERRRFEEANFIRLPGENKKERQKRKRLERGSGGFGANEFGLDTLGDLGDRVGRATERAGKKRRY